MMKDQYLETIMGIERLHRQFFDLVKSELDRNNIRDINDIQCFILYNIGDDKLTVGEISNRGYYMGSNVTYNLKKMVENGYVDQKQAKHDRRSSQIQLSVKGRKLYQYFEDVFKKHADNLERNNLTDEDLKKTAVTLQKLESYWRFLTAHGI